MTNSNYKPIGLILWKILKNPLCNELTYEEAAEYALEFIRLLGAPVAYLTKLEKLELNCYKAEIPCDLLFLEGVRYLDCIDQTGNNTGIAMREATNIYHLNQSEFKGNNNTSSSNGRSEFTYQLQKGVIFTSMEDGFIELAYKAIATDDEGMPMIPE